MPKLNTTVKAVRIDNDKLAELERSLGGQSINSWLNEKITEHLAGKPVVMGTVSGELPYGIQRETLDDLATMCSFMGGNLNTMLSLFDEAANTGEIYFENGRLMGKPPINLDKFLEACREVGADPQKVLDKATAGIRR